jgi:uncharacterized protein YggE
MKKILVLSLAVLLTITSLNSSVAGEINSRSITVSAIGTEEATPDAIKLMFSVTGKASTNKVALANSNKVANSLRVLLKKELIASNDINSSNLYTSPEYRYDEKSKESKLTGYIANQNFTITLRNVSKSGELVDKIVDLGKESIMISGIQPIVLDKSATVKKARVLAVKEAREKADHYAQLLNVSIDKVLTLSESSNSYPIMPVYRSEAVASFDQSTNLDLGVQEITVSITITYSIK